MLHLQSSCFNFAVDIFKNSELNFRDNAADVLRRSRAKLCHNLAAVFTRRGKEPLYIAVIASNDLSLIIFNTNRDTMIL